MFFLDARFRKHDDWGCVSVRDSSLPSPSKLDPRVQGNESLFLWSVKSRKSGIGCFLDARFRKHDGRRGVTGSGFFHGRVVFPLLSPLGLARGSRAKRPYFGGASRVGKAELVVDWILAFARMTAGVGSRVVDSFTGGDTSRF